MKKVMMVPFARRFLLSTTGVNGELRYFDLDLPNTADWGPHLEQMQAHTKLEDATANFLWNIVYWWSLDGIDWEGPFPLFTEEGVEGQKVHAAVNDRTKFGAKLRFALACKTNAGGNVDSGVVSTGVAFEFLS